MRLQTSTTERSGTQRHQTTAEKKRCSKSHSWLRFSLGVALGMVGVTFPETGFARNADPSPTITILVFNHAQASPAILAGAEREAGRILDRAGLGAVWLDCLDRDSADPEGLCHKAREPIDVVLRILPSPIRRWFRDTSFGFAIPPVIASVYYEYVVRLAKSEDAVPVVLGCAIAHEVGHLLLGRMAILWRELCRESGDPNRCAWH
jgi:hypothetical protein